MLLIVGLTSRNASTRLPLTEITKILSLNLEFSSFSSLPPAASDIAMARNAFASVHFCSRADQIDFLQGTVVWEAQRVQRKGLVESSQTSFLSTDFTRKTTKAPAITSPELYLTRKFVTIIM